MTKCRLWAHKPSGSPPQEPSSKAFLPWCCVCFALEWSGRRSRSRLRGDKRGGSTYRTAGGFNRLLLGATEKDSLSLTEPSIPSNTLSLLMSLWMTWLACRKSKACKHCRKWREWEDVAQPFNHQIMWKPSLKSFHGAPGWSVTSRQTAAIWASSMQVSVTTSVSDPPARYSITTNSSSPIRKLTHKHTSWHTATVQLGNVRVVQVSPV